MHNAKLALMRDSRVWPWVGAILSALLLELPFPLAGPMAPWRGIFAWFGLAPLLMALLRCDDRPRPYRDGFLQGWLSGVIWYTGNCYWIYNTMHTHGGISPVASLLILLAFSLILGGYFGLFALGMVFIRHTTHSRLWALAAAPFLWVALELLASRFTSVPWDQLGYSQVDNQLLTRLAPWTGVYGISFILVAANSLLLLRYVRPDKPVRYATLIWVPILLIVQYGRNIQPADAPTTAKAVMVQPNLSVTADNRWGGAEWQQHIDQYTALSGERCNKTYMQGIPETGAPTATLTCADPTTPANLILLPESPAPFEELAPKFRLAMQQLAQTAQSPVIVDEIGMSYDASVSEYRYYNSASIVTVDGQFLGRYDKIHLVPFGEYIPFQNLLSFAHTLTHAVSLFDRGTTRSVYAINGHHYGIFICYEAVFADEIRIFAKNGAEVFVNLSDDGWYGDTSAAWQHLNMARMRAVENRRWILRDTNDGVTAAIDPYGRVRQSIARHTVDALPALYGFRQDVTFYTAHGDVFAYACAILTVALLAWCRIKLPREQAD